MFVLNPDPFLLPSFRISPFRTSDMAFNDAFGNDDFADRYFDSRFKKGHWQYTKNGREAIGVALQNYNLDPNDVVTILTTSQNFYISSCVTKTIEAVCQWNREITDKTKVIFVNHEFGYPYREMEKLLATGIPIIEDCCTTFFSQNADSNVGKYGDFAVYSFPKFFPIQVGGLLTSNKKTIDRPNNLADSEMKYLGKVLSHHLKNAAELIEKRQENFNYAASILAGLGFSERFERNDQIVPSALVLNNHSIVKDLNSLKSFLNAHGIQNSVFYGEDAFFIPSHQNLAVSDCDYFLNCIQAFLNLQ